MTKESQDNYKALLWASRRGMLELDVILTPYLEQHYAAMSASEIKLFSDYLQQDDPDLYAWLMGFETAKSEFSELTAKIRQFIEQRVN
ncbi:succinate dehydrogenase assembly factor 2 [Kangiella sp. TOML190]|uniref:FAD assembly factor SdhE n=1 Tax=Kangiella sp. TOML190 TaxID=2931351 RepID=UPI0020403706|nr:succinate dehydrogenase assembly factor 2 [Kangiella sp. TOML190]